MSNTFRYVVLISVALFLVVPILLAVIVAVTPEDELYTAPGKLYPSRLSLENVRTAFTRGNAATCFLNSLIIALSSALLGVSLGFPAAYVLARYRLRWKAAAMTTLLILRLLPRMPAIAAYYHMVTVCGLVDTPAAVVLVRGGGILLAVWLMKAAVQSVPVSLEQAALLDGFSPWQVVTRVTLPLCLPGLTAAFLLEFVSAWNSFLLPLLFLSSEKRMTIALGIDRFLSGYAIEPGAVMAFAVMVSLPLLVLFPWLFAASLTPYREALLRRRMS